MRFRWMLLLLVFPVLSVAQEKIVKIGFSGPLTGPQAAAGKDNESGLRMAIDELNADKITVDGEKITFVVQVEDDQGDPRLGMGAAQKLIDMDVKAVVGPYNSGVAIPVSRLYQDAGIVMVTVASNPKITMQKFRSVFRVAASDNQLGGKMALYAINELNAKKIAIIDDRTAYGQGLAEEFEKVAKSKGVRIVSRDFTNDKATDFKAILTAIKSRNPDTIFYGGYSAQAGPMLRQMKELALRVTFLGGDGICAPEMGRLAGDVLNEQIYCIQSGALLDKNSSGKFFAEAYLKRYGRPAETHAASFYDAMQLIAHAMKIANSVEPKQYISALEKIHYNGVAGTYEFDSNNNLKQSPVTIYTFRGGLPAALTSY